MHDTLIIPAILTTDPNQYKTIMTAYQAFAKRIHVDFSDGTLSPNVTMPLTGVWWPQGWEIDIHMMVARPSDYLPTILQMKPSLCVFQAETEEDLLPIFAQLKAAGIKAGVALMKPTFPGNVKHLIEAADHAIVFAGELGKQGSTADMLQTEKVQLIKDIKPDIEIAWDGGANMKNVRAIGHSNLEVINVGSAIASAADPAAAFAELQEETDRRGVAL